MEPTTERVLLGEVVPMPMFPFVARKSDDVAVIVLVPLKYGNCPVVPVYREEVAMVRDWVPPELRVVRMPERPRPRVAEEVATEVSAFVPLP